MELKRSVTVFYSPHINPMHLLHPTHDDDVHDDDEDDDDDGDEYDDDDDDEYDDDDDAVFCSTSPNPKQTTCQNSRETLEPRPFGGAQ